MPFRLVAILAADAAGYSRLMAADERATVAALDAARNVFRSQIESNQGRVIDMAATQSLPCSRPRTARFQPLLQSSTSLMRLRTRCRRPGGCVFASAFIWAT